MPMVKREIYREFEALRRQMNRLMESFFIKEPMALLEDSWTRGRELVKRVYLDSVPALFRLRPLRLNLNPMGKKSIITNNGGLDLRVDTGILNSGVFEGEIFKR